MYFRKLSAAESGVTGKTISTERVTKRSVYTATISLQMLISDLVPTILSSKRFVLPCIILSVSNIYCYVLHNEALRAMFAPRIRAQRPERTATCMEKFHPKRGIGIYRFPLSHLV